MVININRYCTKTLIIVFLNNIVSYDKYQQILYENGVVAYNNNTKEIDKYQQILYENLLKNVQLIYVNLDKYQQILYENARSFSGSINIIT